MSRNIPAGLIEISTALAAEGIGHEIVIATPKPVDERSAVKLVTEKFEKIVMRDLHEVVINAETRRTLAAGLMPVINACEAVREAAPYLCGDTHKTAAVQALAKKLALLAATAMDALADGEEAGSNLRYASYNELAAQYKKLGMAVNDCIDGSDSGSTFPHVEIDMEHEPSTRHFVIPKHLARASASGFCGRPSKSKSVLLGLLRNGGFW